MANATKPRPASKTQERTKQSRLLRWVHCTVDHVSAAKASLLKRDKQTAEVLQWVHRTLRDIGPSKTALLLECAIESASESMHGKDAADAANFLANALNTAAKRIHPDR